MCSAKRIGVAVFGAMLAMGTTAASAAVTVTFGESVPVADIITSYEAGTQDQNAWFNDTMANNGNRLITESFITPAGSDYYADKISMKMNVTLASDFPEPRPFSIDFYELTSPGQSPTTGTYLSSRGGYMQPTSATATAGSYFTFDLDTPLTIEAGKSYGYVLAFDAEATYQLMRLAVSSGDADPAGTRAWQNTNGGGWIDTSETYVYYIQGTPVPEPAMGGLVLMAGLGLLGRRKR